jgi:uncharacterized protein YqeY
MAGLPVNDRRAVGRALAELPGMIGAAKEREMGEMVGKLKQVSGRSDGGRAPVLTARSSVTES